MVLIILVLSMSIFMINLFSSKKDIVQMLEEVFIKDHKGLSFNSQKIKKKN